MSIHWARDMRKSPTDAERKLWGRLRLRQLFGHKFRRQHPIGPFIVDFVCLERRLVVEVDGSQHMAGGGGYDERRDIHLASFGYTVIHFWDTEVLREIDSVVQSIALAIGETEAPPS